MANEALKVFHTEKEFRLINNQWFELKDGQLKLALVCPECKWPLVGKVKQIQVSRIGQMFFHENCGPKI